MDVPDWPTDGFVLIANDLNAIRKVMQCLRCEEIPVPKDAMTCRLGHLVCESCYAHLPQCPGKIQSMNPDMNDTESEPCTHKPLVREHTLFTFLYNNSSFKCQFHEHGCKATPKGLNIKMHETMCNYRPIMLCPFSECRTGLPMRNYAQHLSTAHEIVTFDTSIQRVQVPYHRRNKGTPFDKTKRYRWIGALFDCFDLKFMLVVEEEGRHFHMSVILISPALHVQERRFRWTIEFVPLPKARVSLSWPGDVLPLGDDFDVVLTAGEYVLVQKPTMYKNFIFKIKNQEFWNVDVVIRKIQAKEATVNTELMDEPINCPPTLKTKMGK